MFLRIHDPEVLLFSSAEIKTLTVEENVDLLFETLTSVRERSNESRRRNDMLQNLKSDTLDEINNSTKATASGKTTKKTNYAGMSRYDTNTMQLCSNLNMDVQRR
jgi:ABC-type lipopolysaccharide export system ATPase subunit